MMDYEKFKSVRGQLADLVVRQKDIVVATSYDEAAKGTEIPSAQLKKEVDRLKNDDLRVLLMGMFSSGKSAFLNGILGRPLLPMGVLPKTAVIGEISYSEEEDITLIPKIGKWQGGNEPFKIRESELDKYITIDHTADGEKENPFDKVYIKCPLSICKKGITFVDSPGLNDPTCSDRVTREYVPNADAIIYCMSSIAAYTSLDADVIEGLRAIGYTSIIFVLTFFDKVQENDELMGTHDAETLRQHMLKTLAPLTDLGTDGIFFVNSCYAILGKMKGDVEKLNASNFPELERRLENILVNQKGRLKLIRSMAITRGVNRKVGHHLTDSLSVFKQDSQKLKGRLDDAQRLLDNAKEKSSLIHRQVTEGIGDISQNSKDKAALFMVGSLIPEIPNWVNECKPDKGISVTHPKRSCREFAQTIIEHVKLKMASKMNAWCNEDLVKGTITPQFSNLLLTQKDSINQYADDLAKVRVTLDLPISGDEIEQKEGASTASKILASAGSLLIGDIGGAIMGGVLGMKAMLTTLAAELTAGLVVGIIGMFTPVGLPALIIAAVLGIASGGIINILSFEKSVRKKIISEMQTALQQKKDSFVSQVETEVKKSLNKVMNKLADELNVPINEQQKIVSDAKEALNKDGKVLQEKIDSFTKNVSLNRQLGEELDVFTENILA